MATPSYNRGLPSGSGTGSDDQDAYPHLGSQEGDAALFAISKQPKTYKPLTDAEIEILRAGVLGLLPPTKSEELADLLKNNAAATEWVLAEQLLSSANKRASIPDRLSATILEANKPKKASSFRWGGLFSWRHLAIPAGAAAMLVIGIALYKSNNVINPRYTLASLDDRAILDLPGGTLTRGSSAENRTSPEKEVLKFVEIDVRKGLLVPFFKPSESAKQTSDGDGFLDRLSKFLNEPSSATFAFDQALKEELGEDLEENIRLRVYDLFNPENGKLVNGLKIVSIKNSKVQKPRYYVSSGE